MDTALPQKFPFILDGNLAKANCTGNRVCTSCDTVVLGINALPLEAVDDDGGHGAGAQEEEDVHHNSRVVAAQVQEIPDGLWPAGLLLVKGLAIGPHQLVVIEIQSEKCVEYNFLLMVPLSLKFS